MTAHQAPRKSYFPYSRVVIYSKFQGYRCVGDWSIRMVGLI